MLRITGVLLLAGLTLYLCLFFTGVEGRRVRQCEGFLLLLRHIRAQITCFRTPIEQIYAGFENEALRQAGFLAALQKGGFSPALADCRAQLLLEAEEYKLLHAFGQEVGRSLTGEQAALCDYTIAELEKALAHRREEAPRRIRAARSLTLTGGLMLILVLL